MDADLYGNPAAIFKRIQFCHDLEFECAMPAKITKVNNDHTAYAQPLVRLMSSSSSIEQSPILVTTLWDFHGDFEIHHPLNVGDTGWLIAADRNTDLVKQYNSEWNETKNQGAQSPNKDLNLHRYRFGFFLPDRWNTGADKRLVPKELQECFYIRDRNGYVQMLLDEEGTIAITAKSAVEIYGDLFTYDGESIFGGDVTVKGYLNANCDVKVDGKILCSELEVINNARFDNDVTINGSVYVNGKSSRINDMIEQEITVVTGVTQDASNNTVLRLEKMKVLRTNKEHDKDVTITVPKQEGGGGGGGGGLSGIIVEGTDGSSVTSSIGKIVFKSAEDSNVVVKCTQNGDVIEAEVGVYYL